VGGVFVNIWFTLHFVGFFFVLAGISLDRQHSFAVALRVLVCRLIVRQCYTFTGCPSYLLESGKIIQQVGTRCFDESQNSISLINK
jgi:hypothetical protein